MGCGSCGTRNGLPNGCKNNGACGADGCGKLSVFDWLSNMHLPSGQDPFDWVEVRFKNDRKQYYKNTSNLSLNIGDAVAVEASPGHDVGIVTLTGELVRIQMKKRNFFYQIEEIKKIYRKANEKDIITWHEFREKEKQTMINSRIIASNLNLEMKICDVEYQGDGSKVTFYYTAEVRVDFRQLIKEYASKFAVRIEMKQIGYRQEAAKVGGIGSCGRELCCSTWLTDFRSVNTAAARYQQLSINSQKLAGQCGKLKCCLNFELDTYLDALSNFPPMDTTIDTEKGKAVCLKIDVFKREMWFTYEQKGGTIWHSFSIDQVKQFLEINKKGEKTEALEDLSKNIISEKPVIKDVIGEDSLERFERKENRNRNKSRRKNTNKKGDNTTQPKNKNQEPKDSKKVGGDKENKPEQQKPNYNKSNKKPNPNKKKDNHDAQNRGKKQ